jgi:hypothetical protein
MPFNFKDVHRCENAVRAVTEDLLPNASQARPLRGACRHLIIGLGHSWAVIHLCINRGGLTLLWLLDSPTSTYDNERHNSWMEDNDGLRLIHYTLTNKMCTQAIKERYVTPCMSHHNNSEKGYERHRWHKVLHLINRKNATDNHAGFGWNKWWHNKTRTVTQHEWWVKEQSLSTSKIYRNILNVYVPGN